MASESHHITRLPSPSTTRSTIKTRTMKVVTSALLASAFIPTVLASPPTRRTPSEPLHIPLTRRTDANSLTLGDYQAIADNMRMKWNYPPMKAQSASSSSSDNSKRANAATIQTTNQNSDASYFAPVTIGTPGQTLNFILDTGSSDLWAASADCTQCARGTPTFDSSQSSSFQGGPNGGGRELQITYGSGAVQGSLAQDTVSMGPFTVQSQTFTLVDEMTTGLLQGSTSGILGLAFQPLAASRSSPFWLTLATTNQLSSPEFSFWLSRVTGTSAANSRASPNNQPGGAFTLGGTNSSLFTGDIDFVDIPSGVTPSFWFLELQSLTVSGKSVSVPTGQAGLAAIDTGTTLIGGPTSAVNDLFSQIPGSMNLSQIDPSLAGMFSIPCSSSPSLSLSFGGKNTWPISVTDFRLQAIDRQGQNCLAGVFDLSGGQPQPVGSGGPPWIVGDTFLKNVYSVFRQNPPSIGFAELSDAAGGSSGLPSTSKAAQTTRRATTRTAGTGTGTGTGTGGGTRTTATGRTTGTGTGASGTLSSGRSGSSSSGSEGSGSAFSSSPSPSSPNFSSFLSSGGNSTSTATLSGTPGSSSSSSGSSGSSGSGSSSSGALGMRGVGSVVGAWVSVCVGVLVGGLVVGF